MAELPFLVVIAFVLALLLKTFLLQAFFIPSSSMEPTLAVGDRVLVNKVVYQVREPRRGEVVVFRQDDAAFGEPTGNPVTRFLGELGAGLGFSSSGDKDFIKRIIGMPGDMVEMRDGVVYINEVALPEATATDGGYLSQPDPTEFGPVQVPVDHYFMMGDNRPNSADSRFALGTIPRDQVLGRAFVIIWPFSHLTGLSIPSYGGAPATAAGVLPALQPAA